MNVFIVANQEFNLQLTERCSFPFDAKLQELKNSSKSVNEPEIFKKFKRAFDRKFGNQEWALVVKFDICKGNPEEPQTWTITVEGDILKAVHQVLHYGDSCQNLKLNLVALCMRHDTYNRQETKIYQIAARELTRVGSSDNGSFSQNRYSQSNIEIPVLPVSPRPTYSKDVWLLSIYVSATDFIDLTEILPRFNDVNQQIFEDKKFCDVEVVCDDGSIVPCHKAFLSAKSKVFAANLETDFREKQENQIKITDMSAAGVNALLEFIYCNHVYEAIKSCNISLELLRAADMYDIPVLWEAVVSILLEKSHTWYEVDAALSLFDFVSKCERKGSPKLKRKMIQVLAVKPAQLSESQLYKEMFKNEVAREMFNLSLETNKP